MFASMHMNKHMSGKSKSFGKDKQQVVIGVKHFNKIGYFRWLKPEDKSYLQL